MKTLILILLGTSGIAFAFNKPKSHDQDAYNRGYADAMRFLKPQIDSIQQLLDSNYILTPKDYRKLVKSKRIRANK